MFILIYLKYIIYSMHGFYSWYQSLAWQKAQHGTDHLSFLNNFPSQSSYLTQDFHDEHNTIHIKAGSITRWTSQQD